MAAEEVRRCYAGPWVTYIQSVIEALDDGRSRVAGHHLLMLRGRSVRMTMSAVNSAADGVVAVLVKRDTEFVLGNLLHAGPEWVSLQAEYWTACVAVFGVWVKLDMTISILLDDDDSLSRTGLIVGSVHLGAAQRVLLQSARVYLESKTKRFMAQALLVLVTGRMATSALSSSQVSNVN